MKKRMNKKRMNKKRLLKLAALLERDAADPQGVRFDLNQWASPAGVSFFERKSDEVPVSCGTSACAMGLAAISGEFKRAGLSYHFDGSRAVGYLLIPTLKHPGQRTKIGFDAAAELFGVSPEVSEFLFDPTYYRCKTGAAAELDVAKRIRELVELGHDEFRETRVDQWFA